MTENKKIEKISISHHVCLVEGMGKLINYQLSQKLKLLGNGAFNHLTNILTLPLSHIVPYDWV